MKGLGKEARYHFGRLILIAGTILGAVLGYVVTGLVTNLMGVSLAEAVNLQQSMAGLIGIITYLGIAIFEINKF